jgi:spermidine/putrescine transport system ATP-binding protein
MQDFLVISEARKSYGKKPAVDGVSLTIHQGEVFSLLGPSGCGKTTLLRMIAGFEAPDSGCIALNGADITHLAPERRPVNTVFQNYALFPHLSVRDNIAFGLRMERRSRTEIQKTVDHMLHLTRLEEHARKRPAQLSGGQRQRVAIARALVKSPQVLLLDEPLAALDLKLRQHMLRELAALHREVGTTFIYVTHDQGEALSLSNRVAVMNAGRVEQVADPATLYEAPASTFVADFIGDASFLKASIQERLPGGHVRVHIDGIGRPTVTSSSEWRGGDLVKIMIRPENLLISHETPADNDPGNSFQAVITDIAFFGDHERLSLKAGDQVLSARRSRGESGCRPAVGDTCRVRFQPEAARIVDAWS